jgi:DNA helicase II / ATP-dependent DNA helicase PcrA
VPKINLNKNQKRAAQHKEGPLLVIAGAGTGKTRVITERIKHLIDIEKCDSEEILALTFTEKSAQEMEERVADTMPLGYIEPWISTFHSFGDRVLRAEGLEIGLDPSYKILSYPDQWLLLRKNLFELNLRHFRPLGNPTKFISAALKFISRLQDENVSPETFKNFIGKVEDTDEKSRWQELLEIYENYERLKLEQSKLDFGDLIIWTLKLFKTRPTILKKYQTQFKHILVDEFQDTNYAQYELVKTLFPVTGTDNRAAPMGKTPATEPGKLAETANEKSENTAGEKLKEKNTAKETTPTELEGRSLLAVGDDSQSIYKFRGAAISNIMQFREDYKEAETVTLIENYRSTQQILDPAYKLIQNNNPDTLEDKLGISKELKSKLETESKINPQIIQTDTGEEEVEFIVEKILEILGAEPSYTYKDVAILARANNHLEPIVMSLRRHGIPYQLVGNRGLYDRDEVRDIVAFLKVIINPKDSINLYRVLNIDTMGISYEETSELLMQSKIEKVTLWEKVKAISAGSHSPGTQENVADLYGKITKFQGDVADKTPVQFVYDLVQETAYIQQFTEQESIENQMCIKNLDLFLQRVKKFEIDFHNENREMPTIVAFVDYLELIIEAGENPSQAEIEDIDTVNLMTVHASKGLEFPVVFVVNMVSGRFPTRNRSDPIEMPEDLIKEILPTGNPHTQEERRLLYVAITRAKKYLYLTQAKNYGGKRDSKPSGFLQETSLKTMPFSPAEKGTTQTQLFGKESGFRDPSKIPADFTPKYLSYSQVSTYDNCPLQYKYRYVLNVPSQPSHALSFGITIHDTLRDFHRKLLFEPVSLENLYEMYTKNWHPLGFMNEEHRQHQFGEGKKLLKIYYETNKDSTVKPIGLEKSFKLSVGGIKFYGRIDRIDKIPEGGVEIIDYKTGKTKTQKQVDKDEQVGFYAIAARDALGMQPKKLTYYFIEENKRVSTTRTPEQLDALRDKTQETIADIKTGDFAPSPSMLCNWCDYNTICPHAWKK